MSFVVKSSDVPEGVYDAAFDSIEPGEHPEYGLNLLWGFRIQGGPSDGMVSTRTTGQIQSAEAAMGKFVQGVCGALAKPGKPFVLDDFLGTECTITVKTRPSGNGTRVESVIAKPKG